MKPNIGISQKNLDGVNNILSIVLADAHVLYIKARKFHWNVSGPSFMELHKLFEVHYTQLGESIDEIAERITKLGGIVPGTMAEFIKASSLKEAPTKIPTQEGMIKELLNDHEIIATSLRKHIDNCDEKYKDVGSADFLTSLLTSHETLAWTLRRYIK